MKILKYIASLSILCFLATSCSSDDNKDTDKKEPKLHLTASSNEITVDQDITFSIFADGKPVNDAIITLADGEQIANNKWTAVKAGIFYFTASKKGFQTSERISITVKEKEKEEEKEPEVKGEGTFTYKGKTYTIDKSTLSFEGKFKSDDNSFEAGWIIDSVNNESGLSVLSICFTPIITTAEGKEMYQLPNETNITSTMLSIFQDASEIYYTRTNVTIKAKLEQTKYEEIASGYIKTTCTNVNQEDFSLEYRGLHHLHLQNWTDS
ncbi:MULTISPECIES: hypothetical protein [Myroides]|uniref:Lipoprotein n=1 Tax=Myroides albus TaxID=2562892 RepID=A0A6I3LGZ3_9FLAO|nr:MULTISPECIES: hypothetical protein [Myroides]MTG97074.1 hypothetical protein [Myroides albus]MVX34805.1 hypothetical protein [Myroides sp. LoEW2-1]UVD78503.1 hypothetical protein NWE55_10210 [Myroides albus]